MNDTESQFEPNSARFTDVLSNLKIKMVKIEDWIILQRSMFDITMHDEPFTALQLYLNTQTRAYITRVWGRTFSRGTTTGSLADIEVLCNQTFAQGMACCPGTSGKEVRSSLMLVNYPFTRLVSQNCIAFHKSNAPCGVHLPVAVCTECIASSEAPTVIKEENIHPSDLYPEVHIKENDYEDNKVYPVDHAVQMRDETIDDIIKQEPNMGNDQGSLLMHKEAITEADAKYNAWLENENIESLVNKKEKKCPDCSFSAHTDRGLKSHITRIHTNKNIKGTDKGEEPIKSIKVLGEHEGKVSCNLCDFTTTSSQSMVNHVLEHNGLQLYKCDECPFEARLKGALDIHKESKHPSKVRYKIEVPNIPKPYRMTCGRRQVTPDEWKHGAKMMECEHCGKSLARNPETISIHYRCYHLWGNFYCSLCDFFAYYPKEYATHMLARHPDMDSGVSTKCCECGEEVQLDGDVNALAEHYKDCASAYDKMKRKGHYANFRSKIDKNKTVICDVCGKDVRSDLIHGHMRNHRETQSLHCKYVSCAILFPTIKEKRKHERLVHKTKAHCDQCGHEFSHRGELRQHIISVHERKSMDLKCTFPGCTEVFINRASRTHHMNRIHFPNKFKCEYCGKSCGSSVQLKDHVIIHTGERRFQCPVCDRKFKKRDDLTDHKRTHETDILKQKPFACEYCPYRGGSRSLLRHHKLQKHKVEFEEEKREREQSKIKVSSDMEGAKNN